MPFARVTLSSSGSVDAKDLASKVSKAVALALGKPEQYMMVVIEPVVPPSVLLFGGSDEPAAMVGIESVGGTCSAVAEAVTKVLVESGLGIDASRVFVNLNAFSGKEWAMAGNTF
jgi:phenylpyruvate tautomerase PptA (4-oxalocrotonate tautomerase family)